MKTLKKKKKGNTFNSWKKPMLFGHINFNLFSEVFVDLRSLVLIPGEGVRGS